MRQMGTEGICRIGCERSRGTRDPTGGRRWNADPTGGRGVRVHMSAVAGRPPYR